jgi:glycosyltransferase involved in cell wall biosynthesis
MGYIPAPRDSSRMRVLVVHNPYREPGGEDGVVKAEVGLLRSRGHEVELFERCNEEIDALGALNATVQALWSADSAARLRTLLGGFQPRVVHVHNTFALISPSVYWACASVGVPVIQTLHNFRLLCPQAMLLRDGRVCEDCVGRLPWRGVVRRCYRGSVGQSAVLAASLTMHRAIGTYRNKVARYIALNDFCRRKFIAGGLPADRIDIKPNFADAPAPRPGPRDGFLFVGRLSPEKGLSVLARACMEGDLAVRVIGDGPLAAALASAPGLTMLGRRDAQGVRSEMSSAMALVLPSVWYENLPLTLVEAYASGLPVIASRLGALEELVEHGVTGLLFEPGDARALATMMRWAAANPKDMLRMAAAARQRYEQLYTAERNYTQLMGIYARAGCTA